MFRLIITLLLMTTPVFATEWNKALPAGTDLKSAWPAASVGNNDALDRALTNNRQNMFLTFSSASTIAVTDGTITCSNSGGTLRKFRTNPSSTNVTFSDIDTGSEAAGTYYIYANCDASADTATFKISASSTSPSGVTSYRRLGYFVNDGSLNITASSIVNDNVLIAAPLGAWAAKSIDTAYQASTDGFVVFWCGDVGNGDEFQILTDSSNPPTTVRGKVGTASGTTAFYGQVTSPVKKNEYYKVSSASGTCSSSAIYFIPLGT